jgi:hypothetical protein
MIAKKSRNALLEHGAEVDIHRSQTIASFIGTRKLLAVFKIPFYWLRSAVKERRFLAPLVQRQENVSHFQHFISPEIDSANNNSD